MINMNDEMPWDEVNKACDNCFAEGFHEFHSERKCCHNGRFIYESQARALWEGASWIIKTYEDAGFCGSDMDEQERKDFDQAIALLKRGIECE